MSATWSRFFRICLDIVWGIEFVTVTDLTKSWSKFWTVWMASGERTPWVAQIRTPMAPSRFSACKRFRTKIKTVFYFERVFLPPQQLSCLSLCQWRRQLEHTFCHAHHPTLAFPETETKMIFLSFKKTATQLEIAAPHLVFFIFHAVPCKSCDWLGHRRLVAIHANGPSGLPPPHRHVTAALPSHASVWTLGWNDSSTTGFFIGRFYGGF